MIYASVCSGVEAASLAWMPLGWEAAWFSEIEPFPCAILKHRFPEVPNLGDMTKIKVETIENETGKLQRFKNESGADAVVPGGVDLLVGGTPCQGFSFAGKQDGLDDPRSALCLAYCELLETMRPKWFVWENVPGVFSTNQGDDFRAFLRKIDEIGYSVAWRVLDAQYVRVDGYPRAVPQRRRRVFVVGHLGDWRYPASVLFEPESVFRNTPPRRSKGAGVARCLTASTGGASGKEQQHTFVICSAGDTANSEIGVGVATTQLARQYKSPPFICAGFMGGQGSKAAGIAYSDELAPTIKASSSGSNSVPDVLCVHGSQDPVTQPLNQSMFGGIIGASNQDMFSQNANGLGVCVANTSSKVCHNAVVRSLLPVECERLMGFPDNWTRIPWRSKPEEECPDSHRYKACGNSMCVNVMRWIGMRIELTERKLK